VQTCALPISPGGGGRPPRRPTPDAAAPRAPRCAPAPGHRSGPPVRPDRVLPAPSADAVRRRLPDRELHPGRTPHEGLLLPAVPARRPPPRPGRPQGGPRGRSVASARHLPGGAAVDARPARPGGRHRGPALLGGELRRAARCQGLEEIAVDTGRGTGGVSALLTDGGGDVYRAAQ